MKTIVKFCALLLMFQAGTLVMSPTASAQYVETNFQVFYDQLSPYGMWVEDPNYGYVWIPDVGPGFRPYASGGYWVLTEFGWTWVSHYRWGWAPFHYGRWYFEPVYGWIWVPGNEWGPAWVTWRRCNGYYGWVPMGPGINISMTFGPRYVVPEEHWIFVRDVDFGRNDIDRYYIRRSENGSILRKTAVITNTRSDNSRHITYITGPDKKEVQRVSQRTVQVLPIRETTQPGHVVSNGQLQIYRPVVQKTTTKGVRPVPGKVVNIREVKPVAERGYTNPKRQEQPKPIENQQENKKSMVQPVQQHNTAQPAQQHNTVQPVQKKTQQPANRTKQVSKPKEEQKVKENEPRK